VRNVYADNDPTEPTAPDPDATPGLAPRSTPGINAVELVVDGESFVVTRRADAPGTYDFDWTSHLESYGFGVSRNASWTPDRDELGELIRSFLAEIDPETGYLPD